MEIVASTDNVHAPTAPAQTIAQNKPAVPTKLAAQREIAADKKNVTAKTVSALEDAQPSPTIVVLANNAVLRETAAKTREYPVPANNVRVQEDVVRKLIVANQKLVVQKETVVREVFALVKTVSVPNTVPNQKMNAAPNKFVVPQETAVKRETVLVRDAIAENNVLRSLQENQTAVSNKLAVNQGTAVYQTEDVSAKGAAVSQ